MLNDIQVTGNKDTRSGFGDGILEAARTNDRIVALTADLLGQTKLPSMNNRSKESLVYYQYRNGFLKNSLMRYHISINQFYLRWIKT